MTVAQRAAVLMAQFEALLLEADGSTRVPPALRREIVDVALDDPDVTCASSDDARRRQRVDPDVATRGRMTVCIIRPDAATRADRDDPDRDTRSGCGPVVG